MITQMPQQLREKVIKLLEANDFRAAKELHDNWLLQLKKQADDKKDDANIFLPIH